jgi:hypothetical protein
MRLSLHGCSNHVLVVFTKKNHVLVGFFFLVKVLVGLYYIVAQSEIKIDYTRALKVRIWTLIQTSREL